MIRICLYCWIKIVLCWGSAWYLQRVVICMLVSIIPLWRSCKYILPRYRTWNKCLSYVYYLFCPVYAYYILPSGNEWSLFVIPLSLFVVVVVCGIDNPRVPLKSTYYGSNPTAFVKNWFYALGSPWARGNPARAGLRTFRLGTLP